MHTERRTVLAGQDGRGACGAAPSVRSRRTIRRSRRAGGEVAIFHTHVYSFVLPIKSVSVIDGGRRALARFATS